MNKSALFAAVLTFLFVAGTLCGQQIKLKGAAPKPAPEESAPAVSEAETEPEASEQGTESDDAATEEPASDASKPETAKARKQRSAEASSEKDADVVLPLRDASAKKDGDAEDRVEKAPVVENSAKMVVEEIIPTKLVRDVRTLRAMTRVSREEFVPRKRRAAAYLNSEVQLDDGARLESPLNDALILQAAGVRPEDCVLVVEDVAGWLSAVVGLEGGEVFMTTRDRNSARRAAAALKSVGAENVAVKIAEPEAGWSDQAPFDKIILARAVPDFPQTLVEQLKDGGTIVAPVGSRLRQILTIGVKNGDSLSEEPVIAVRMDSAVDETSGRKENFEETALLGGDFETLDPAPNSDEDGAGESASPFSFLSPNPEGWRDGLNFSISEEGAYEGRRACRFDNMRVYADHLRKDRNAERIRAATLPEDRRSAGEYGAYLQRRQRANEIVAQLKQTVSLPGSTVKRANLSGAYRLSNISDPDGVKHAFALIKIVFLDRDRNALEERVLLEVPESAAGNEWRPFSIDVPVPARSRDATITIGILDGVGVVEFDALTLADKREKNSGAGKRRMDK